MFLDFVITFTMQKAEPIWQVSRPCLPRLWTTMQENWEFWRKKTAILPVWISEMVWLQLSLSNIRHLVLKDRPRPSWIIRMHPRRQPRSQEMRLFDSLIVILRPWKQFFPVQNVLPRFVRPKKRQKPIFWQNRSILLIPMENWQTVWKKIRKNAKYLLSREIPPAALQNQPETVIIRLFYQSVGKYWMWKKQR